MLMVDTEFGRGRTIAADRRADLSVVWSVLRPCRVGAFWLERRAIRGCRVRDVGLDVVARRRVNTNCSGASGCSWILSAVCAEYARKLSGGRAFSLVTALPPKHCKAIAIEQWWCGSGPAGPPTGALASPRSPVGDD
jgi:hypothetical protein